MSQPRDSQRSRLYEAERRLPGYFDLLADGSMPGVERYLLRVTGSAWFRRRWPKKAAISGVLAFRLKDGRRWAWARAGGRSMVLPIWARGPFVILHELAHIVTPWNFPAHGREFARNFIELVGYALGKAKADELKTAFDAGRVKWRKAPSKRARRPVSAATLEALARGRAKLAATRAAKGESR